MTQELIRYGRKPKRAAAGVPTFVGSLLVETISPAASAARDSSS